MNNGELKPYGLEIIPKLNFTFDACTTYPPCQKNLF
jgi:hypothetical protein